MLQRSEICVSLECLDADPPASILIHLPDSRSVRDPPQLEANWLVTEVRATCFDIYRTHFMNSTFRRLFNSSVPPLLSRSSSSMASAPLPNLPFFQRAHAAALKNPSKPAIIDARTNKEHTYVDLLKDASQFREKIAKGSEDIQQARVAALVPNGCKLVYFGRFMTCDVFWIRLQD